jgi:hypothetical protein
MARPRSATPADLAALLGLSACVIGLMLVFNASRFAYVIPAMVLGATLIGAIGLLRQKSKRRRR